MLEVEDGFDAPAEPATNDETDYPRQQEIRADGSSGDSVSGDAPKEQDRFDSDNYSEGENENFADSEATTDWNESIPNELPVDTSWDDVYQSASSGSSNYDGEDNDYYSRRAATDSLYDHLMWQLNLTPMSD